MTGPSTINKVILSVLRYFIASVLFLTGLGKLLDIPGFVEVLDTYQVIPGWGLHVAAVGMVLLELRICEWLLWDKTLILGARSSLIFHSLYTLWTTITLIREIPISNCGCFGVFFARPLTGWTVVEDLILVVASFVLLSLAIKQKRGSKQISKNTKQMKSTYEMF